jgi:glycosyltransferase involved in cell wall biosynthesis
MISVCIPTYEMHGKGVPLLKRSFDMLAAQTFKDFEVVVTDNSENDVIQKACDNYKNILNINYSKNPRKGMAQNTNEAIKNAKGDLIKILYQDDFLASENSLQEIADNFKGYWLVTACGRDDTNKPHIPKYNNEISKGKNSIGSPSVLTIKNDNPLLFDEKMTWLLDCDYYKRLYDKYGEPVILNKVNVIIGVGKHQTTHVLSDTIKKSEHNYMSEKYDKTG